MGLSESMRQAQYRMVFTLFTLLSFFKADAGQFLDQMSERIRSRIEMIAGEDTLFIDQTEKIYSRFMLPRFYEQRGFHPAWHTERSPKIIVDSLISVIQHAFDEGLDPQDYHLQTISERVQLLREKRRGPDLELCTDLEMLCTDAFLLLGSHFLSGKVDPITIDSQWLANRRGADMSVILESAVAKSDVSEVLYALLPKMHEYQWLKQNLRVYRQIQQHGGWAEVRPEDAFKLNQQDDRIVTIRERLAVQDDLVLGELTNPVYDQSLVDAIKRFQKRMGFEPTGLLSEQTLNEMMLPVEERIKQIVVNMERWRWLPQQLGNRYLFINVANFELEYIRNESVLFSSRVIVGKSYRKTPVFSDQITYLVFNPYWHVPNNIAIHDLLPEIKKNVQYLKEKGIRVFRGWGSDAAEIEATGIDWGQIRPDSFPYHFIQDPGPQNALGLVKFMFPNPFNVYLHDTPSRSLFEKTERTFSSGCIRVEHALELASFLLREDGSKSESIGRIIQSGMENTVYLNSPVPIHLLYWTAWVDPDGVLQFRRDIYGRDSKLYLALKEKRIERRQ